MEHTQTANVKKAVITVAGLGTRFLPATKAVMKCLLPVLDKPVIQYIAEEMADSGIKEIIFVVSPEHQSLKDHFKRDFVLESALRRAGKLDRIKSLNDLIAKVKFSYAVQPKPFGNGHALLCARNLIGDEPFAFSDGDSIIDSKVPAIKQILKVYYQYGASVIGAQRIKDKKVMITKGNVFAKEIRNKKLETSPPAGGLKLHLIKKLVEKPDIDHVSPQGLIVGGMRYVFTPDIWPVLKRLKPSREGEIWLSEAANALAQKRPFYAYEYEGKYFDTGNPRALLKTAVYFAEKFSSGVAK
ncbi:MAG: sugar phosphate nucleotidyltransferase [Patescibacteria group bacterium]